MKNPIDFHLAIGTEIGARVGAAGKRKGVGRVVQDRRSRETIWDINYFCSINDSLLFYLHGKLPGDY